MTQEERFDAQAEATLQEIRELLIVKGKEYRRNNNVYHNFDKGAKMVGLIPEKVLHGFLLKHLISYQDMLNDIEKGNYPKPALVEEKFNDIITYYVIQKCMILDRIENLK